MHSTSFRNREIVRLIWKFTNEELLEALEQHRQTQLKRKSEEDAALSSPSRKEPRLTKEG